MSKYTDEEKIATLRRARALLEEGIAEQPRPYSPPAEPQAAGWKQRAEELEAAKERHRLESEVAAIERRVEQQLRAVLTDSFKSLVEAEHDYLVNELFPELFNTIADSVRDEIKETVVAELRADVAAIKKRLGIEVVTDLPAIPLRQRPN
jgi:hypothetical protein